VGDASLDAMIGHLAASTGGQVFAAAGDNVAPAILAALNAMRRGTVPLDCKVHKGVPVGLETMRSGISIEAKWSGRKSNRACDAVGRFAAGLALPALDEVAARALAVAHGLSSHLTSLVLVDEASEPTNALPVTRKIPLSAPVNVPAPAFLARSAGRFLELNQELPDMPARLGANNDWSLTAKAPPTVALPAPSQDVDWDTLADALIRLDHDAWPKELVEYVARMSERKEIKSLARRIKLNPEAVVVLLLAVRGAPGNRGAARVARAFSRGLSKIALAAIEVRARQMTVAVRAIRSVAGVDR
jgi:hypothetical protein